MYLAELHGKLSSKLQNMEDILTSNVFSFFKYTNRTIFLNRFMKRLGFVFTENELQTAEFIFWPSLDDQTEPDLVLVIGNKYIMVEAKYFAGFEPETRSRKAQLIREIEGGLREAENMNMDFYLVAITADYTYRKERFKLIQDRYKVEFNWINWQSVAGIIYEALEKNDQLNHTEKLFALDLYNLLGKKNLRNYLGKNAFLKTKPALRRLPSVFFDATSAIFRGEFIGFLQSLQFAKKIDPTVFKFIRLNAKSYFNSLQLRERKLYQPNESIFFEEPNN
jgi:hypothetical protein